MTIAPIVVRLFEPFSLISQKGALLPPYASTVDMPSAFWASTTPVRQARWAISKHRTQRRCS
jgi:hypothetical protein